MNTNNIIDLEHRVRFMKIFNNYTKEEIFDSAKFLLCEVLEKDKEIERLNNIINELEKWLDKEINQLKLEDNYESADTLEIVQEELQELKGSDKE